MDIFLNRVEHQIKSDFPDLSLRDLEIIGRGAVFSVVKGTARDGRILGIRIAPEHWIETNSSHPVSAVDLLTQECLISTHCRSHDIPAPTIVGQSLRSGREGGLDLFIYEWLEDDGLPPENYHMGQVLRKVHEINPPAFEPVAMRGSTFEKIVTHRILDAAANVVRNSGRPLLMPSMETLLAHLSWPDKRTSLLHMDYHPVNLHASDGKVSGIMGWCDALIGPPTMELVHLDELDVLDDSFLGGYADYEMYKAPVPVETAFRLDTATHRADALLRDAPGSAETRKAVNRVAFLFEEFNRLSSH